MHALRKFGLPGECYGKLVVIEEVPKKGGRRRVRCRCDCGSETEVRLSHLRDGTTVGCGCQRDVHKFTHGMSGTSEYCCWQHIIDRCCNPRSKDYPNWGGRSISIAPEWRESFQAFYDHIGPRPGFGYTVDRIDNDGNYEPGNVRWATRRTQARNTRVNRRLEFEGRSLTLGEWAEVLGVSRRTLITRLSRGWTLDRTLTQPVKKVDQTWRS